MKKLLALWMAFALTFQLVTPVFAEEIEETQAATEAVEVETEAPVTEAPTTEPPVPETAAPEKTSAPTEPQPTTEVTEAAETTASTEETTTASTEPTEETTEPTLDLLSEDENVIASGECGADGDNLTWVLTEDGTLTISGDGCMDDYAETNGSGTVLNQPPWAPYKEDISKVLVEGRVRNVGNAAFHSCDNLDSVTIFEGVKNIGIYAFYACASLTSISIPVSVAQVEEKAFYECHNLKDVYYNGTKEKWSEISIAGGNSDLLRVALHTSIGGICGEKLIWELDLNGILTISGTGPMYDFDDNSAPWVSRPYQINTVLLCKGVTSIGRCAFQDCNTMTSVVIPNGLTAIGNAAFDGCSALNNITIPSSVISIGSQAFNGCESLTGIDIPEGVTAIEEETFRDCSSLISVILPKSVTEIGWRAFASCSGLSNVVIPDSVKRIAGCAFLDCNSLTSVIIPEGVTKIAYGTFENCTNLEDVTLPLGLRSIESGYYSYDNFFGAFENCASLKSIVIPESVDSICAGAFRGCTSLISIVIPESVTRIEESTFYGCSKLENVRLPKTLKRVCKFAFYDCGSIQRVYYGSSQKSWNKIRIDDCNWDLKNAKRYYNVTEEPGVAEPSVKIYPIDTDYLVRGSKLALTVYKMPQKEEVDVRWSLDGDSRDYAYIDENGVLMAKSGDEVQKITVIATPTDGSPELRKTLWRLPPAKKISLCLGDKSVPEVLDWDIYDNATLDFYAEVQPKGALTQVTWSSNNPKVAAVAADGTVTLLKPGTAVIKATAADGSKVAAQVTLNVIYTNHSPKLGVSALKLNTAYSLGTTVDFVEQLGNQVEVVSVDDDRFDVSYEDNRLTLKAQEPGLKGTYKLTLEAGCADGRTYSYPLTVKAAPILPRLTVKQTEKFNLFYRDSEAALTITGGEVEEAELISSDFVLDNKEGQWVIRYADPENAPAKPNTKAILSVTFAGYSMPVTKTLTISAVNTAPKLTMNPTSSILNTTLIEDSTVETALFWAEGDNLSVWAEPSSVDVSLTDGVLSISLNEPKAVTASIYVQNDNWVKPVKLTHRITVTDKKPTVKLSAKGKLDVLNPASEIIYTPKLSNATGTIESVRLEGADAELFNAEVVDGLVHLKLAKSGENYSTRKTYKVTPVVTLLGKDIAVPILSIKVTQSALKLAKLPNRTVYQSQTAPLAVKLAVTSPANVKIGDVQLHAKTTAAFRNALEAAGGIQADEAAVSFPAKAFAALKPGRYTVILDVTPANAASDTKPTQAKFTLTVQK